MFNNYGSDCAVKNDFQQDIMTAAKSLKKEFSCGLGVIYDKPIIVPTLNTLLILTVNEIKDKENFKFDTTKYRWFPRHHIEHELYQGYNNLELIEPLDRQSDGYDGPRWIEAAIQFSKKYEHIPLDKGLYLGYFQIALSEC